MMQPSQFIVPGSSVKALFVISDESRKWYNGIVRDVHRYNVEEGYVECDVFYKEDKDLVKFCKFYDDDYDSVKSLDAWSFYGETERDFDLFEDIYQKLEDNKNPKTCKTYSMFGLCFTAVMLITAYGAAFMQLECAKDTSEWCDPIKKTLSPLFSSP